MDRIFPVLQALGWTAVCAVAVCVLWFFGGLIITMFQAVANPDAYSRSLDRYYEKEDRVEREIFEPRSNYEPYESKEPMFEGIDLECGIQASNDGNYYHWQWQRTRYDDGSGTATVKKSQIDKDTYERGQDRRHDQMLMKSDDITIRIEDIDPWLTKPYPSWDWRWEGEKFIRGEGSIKPCEARKKERAALWDEATKVPAEATAVSPKIERGDDDE